MKIHLKILSLTLIFLNFTPLALAKPSVKKQTPERILFLVFDQMRPDYVERFDLKNFKRLQKMGVNYKNAYVGHDASVTVVSHIVMTTGLLPKDLPWNDGITWDKDGVFGTPDSVVKTTEAGSEALMKAVKTLPENVFLIRQLKEKYPGKYFAVGQKDYSTTVMGGPYVDSLIFMKKNEAKQCQPSGVNVPAYISQNERYTVDCKNTYGTEDSLYVLDGNKFYPGTDEKHLGGDIWVADMALDLMKNNPDWRGMFLTFGAIDKFGHMLGETDGETPHSFESPMHLKEIAQIADKQLGRLLDELQSKNLLSKTLIVQTADHGGQTDTIYLGAGGGKSDPFWMGRIAKAATIRCTALDTGMRIWVKDYDPAKKDMIVNRIKEVSKVTRIYSLRKNSDGKYDYQEEYNNVKSEPLKFQKWANAHDQELANTMANERAPQFLAFFADGVGFARLGDHGGNQELVQRIPLTIVSPNLRPHAEIKPARLVDIKPMILKEFGL